MNKHVRHDSVREAGDSPSSPDVRKARNGPSVPAVRQGVASREISRDCDTSRGRTSTRGKVAMLFVCAGLSLVGLGDNSKHSSGADTRPNKQPISDPSKPMIEFADIDKAERDTDSMIPKIEAAFAEWERKLQPLIDAVPDEDLKLRLMGPFRIVAENADNPNRNIVRLFRGRKTGEVIHRSNPAFFGYEVSSDHIPGGMVAAFGAVARTMFLSETFNPKDASDFLLAYHEACHAVNDTGFRRSNPSREELAGYFKFQTDGRKKTILPEEARAFALEIEILNLMLNGGLRQAARVGKILDPVEILAKLGSSSDKLPEFNTILVLANAYYSGGGAGTINERFLVTIASAYMQAGYEVHDFVPGQGLVRVGVQ